MEYTADTPRANRTIAGRILSVIQPYSEGQPLTEATAAMLNQTFAENISNNMRKTLDDESIDDAKAQELVDAYMAEYVPGVRTGGGGTPRVTDPVEREARKLARSVVLEKVKAAGLKAKDVDMAALTEKAFEANLKYFMAEGKKIVASQTKASELTLELDLGGDQEEAAA